MAWSVSFHTSIAIIMQKLAAKVLEMLAYHATHLIKALCFGCRGSTSRKSMSPGGWCRTQCSSVPCFSTGRLKLPLIIARLIVYGSSFRAASWFAFGWRQAVRPCFEKNFGGKLHLNHHHKLSVRVNYCLRFRIQSRVIAIISASVWPQDGGLLSYICCMGVVWT